MFGCFSHASSLLAFCLVFCSLLDRASGVFGFGIVVIFGGLLTTSELFCRRLTRRFPEIFALAIRADRRAWEIFALTFTPDLHRQLAQMKWHFD